MDKNINFKDWFIIMLIFAVVVLGDTVWLKNKELEKKQTSIEDLTIQVNNLWENVLQLQEEYGKIIDKLYNPNNNSNLGVDDNAQN